MIKLVSLRRAEIHHVHGNIPVISCQFSSAAFFLLKSGLVWKEFLRNLIFRRR